MADATPPRKARDRLDEEARSRLPARSEAARLPDRIPRCAPPRQEGSTQPEAASHYQEGLDAASRGDLDAAEAALRRALARDDRHPAAWRELGVLLVELQRFDEALRPLAQALKIDPGDHEMLRFRALCEDRLDQVEVALASYREFLDVCPPEHEKPRVHALIRVERLERPGISNAATGAVPGERIARRQEQMERVHASVPRCEPPSREGSERYQEALEFLEADDREAAEAALRRALLEHDRHAATWRELGFLLVDLDRHEEAQRPLETALELAPEDFEAIRFLAIVNQRLERIEAAEEGYTRFLDLCPDAFQRTRMHASRQLVILGRSGSERQIAGLRPGVGESAATDEVQEMMPPGPLDLLRGLALPGVLLLFIGWMIFGGTESLPRARRPTLGQDAALLHFRAAAAAVLTSSPDFQDMAEELKRGELLGEGSPEDRLPEVQEVLDALGATGDERAVPAIHHLLMPPEGPLAAPAVRTLHSLATSASYRSLENLLIVTRDHGSIPSVRMTMELLAKDPSPWAARALVNALAVTARKWPDSRRGWDHRRLLRATIARADPEGVAAAIETARKRLAETPGRADRKVIAELDACLESLDGPES